MRRKRIDDVEARRRLGSLFTSDIRLIEPTDHRRAEAFGLALTHDIAYYDALYLQLTAETGLPLLTADQPFHDRVAGAFPVTFLGAL